MWEGGGNVQPSHGNSPLRCCVSCFSCCLDWLPDRKPPKTGRLASELQLREGRSPLWCRRHSDWQGRPAGCVLSIVRKQGTYGKRGLGCKTLRPAPRDSLLSGIFHPLKAHILPKQHHHLGTKWSNTWACGAISDSNHSWCLSPFGVVRLEYQGVIYKENECMSHRPGCLRAGCQHPAKAFMLCHLHRWKEKEREQERPHLLS